MKKFSFTLWLAAAALFFSCQKESRTSLSAEEAKASQRMQATRNAGKDLDGIMFYALAEGNRLDLFSVDQSERLVSSVNITGLQQGEDILAIDFRPATGQLYGLGSLSRLYVINTTNGLARPVGSAAFSPALSGMLAGFDFNPTVDRIRVVTAEGQNLRLHPETGAVVAMDGPVNGAMVTSVAYTNNIAGASSTTLYDIDVASDKLFRQDPPNNGTLVEVGSLNANLEGEGGFDIAPAEGSAPAVAFALYQQNKKSVLYTIDLQTGRARKVEKFSRNEVYRGLAIPTKPVAYAVSNNNLLILHPAGNTATSIKAITGLQPGEGILGIDFRPANSALYALGSNSRIYTINTANGAASFVASLTEALSGTSFGFDFNPVPDRIRIISNTGQNLRVNPITGAAANDKPINPAPAFINAAAYTNSFAGATTTTLYVIDSDKDMLYIQNPPNDGTLTNGKSLVVDIDASNGFDIGGTSNMAYGIFTSGGQTSLYGIDLMNGTAMPLRTITGPVSGFALGLGF